jgi:cytochrome c oxidase subunit 2
MKNLDVQLLFALALLCPAVASAQQYDKVVSGSQSLANKICVTCHGAEGKGNPIVGAPRLAGIESWYLRNQLQAFRADYRGREKDYIPAYEMQDSVARMSDQEIEDVVAYIATWQTTENAPTISADANRGSQLYLACAACHGVNAEGNEALAAPGLTEKDDWYLFRQLKLFQSGYRGGHPEDQLGQQMRAGMGAIESEQDIEDVLAYINSL